MNQVKVLPDVDQLAQAAAERFIEAAAEAVRERNEFRVALAGGSTPRDTYQRLAAADLAPLVSWRNVQFFWGDERCVAPHHPDSNFRMARDTLLDKVPVPQSNLHRIQGELKPQEAAQTYAEELRTVFNSRRRPHFDLVLLGMGADGHTASLFPGSPALNELRRWVVAVFASQLDAWRVTLTPPLLNAARQVIFLVAGTAKAARVKEVLHGERDPRRLPAQLVRPKHGSVIWMMDQAAAAEL